MRFGDLLRGRLLMAAILAVLAGLLGMQQLSVDHTAVVPSPAQAAFQDQLQHHPSTGTPPDTADDHGRAGHDAGCAGCGDHGVGMIGCLMVVGLFLLGWLIRPQHRPGVRPVPHRGHEPPIRRIMINWRRAPLSLLELEISRT